MTGQFDVRAFAKELADYKRVTRETPPTTEEVFLASLTRIEAHLQFIGDTLAIIATTDRSNTA